MQTSRFTRSRITLILAAVLLLALSVSLAQAQETGGVIKIASQSQLSGSQSPIGTAIRNGVELAIDQLGGPLRDMGYDVQYVPYDDQATAEVGVSNAQQLVADPSILAIVGHFNSGVAIPSSEVYQQNSLAMISPGATNPTLTERGLSAVNRVVGRDDLQGPTGAQFAASLDGVESVYILQDTTAYGQGVGGFFRDEAEAQGLTVLGFEGVEERTNFEGILQPILALDPDLIYMAGIYDQFGVFVNQARAAGYTGLFMGPDGIDSSDFAELGGEAAVGTYYTSVVAPAGQYPAAAQFIEDYTATYGEAPGPFAAQGYDAAGILLAAFERLAAANGGTLPTREEVVAEVRNTVDYEGITGTITFDANGDPEVSTYYVLQVGSADPAAWGNNTIISSLEIPSPLYAAEMAAMGDAEATPEATPES
jgi:branched-chain amino acid transport system substrate-binding protein